jgi:hypothetical protein
MRCAAGGAITHLFADLLRARLQEEQPGRVLELHRNAAAWYAEHGLADDAIRHAVTAREMTWAARLIEQHYDELFYLHSEGETIHRWLSALPEDLVRSRPRLLLTQAFLALISGRLEAVEPLLDAAQQAYADAAEEPFEPTVGRARRRCGWMHSVLPAESIWVNRDRPGVPKSGPGRGRRPGSAARAGRPGRRPGRR